MRNLTFVLALTALAAQGCIIYENDDCNGGCWGDWEDRWDDGWCDADADSDDPDCDEPGDEPGDDVPAFTLSLDPGHAELGETFLAHLTAEGEFDVAAVATVQFTHGVDVLWAENRGTEVLLLVEVPQDAQLGAADLVISRNEAPAVLFEGALSVFEAGSGNSADDCE